MFKIDVMKKTAIIVILVAFGISISKAQTIFRNASANEKEFTVKGRSYKYKKVAQRYVQIEGGKVEKSNGSNAKTSQMQQVPEVTYFRTNDKEAVLKAFNKVFNPNRLNELSGENAMIITYNIDVSTGRIKNCIFFFPSRTSITPEEVDALSNALKANVSVTFNAEEVKGRGCVNLSQRIRYSKIVDRTLTF